MPFFMLISGYLFSYSLENKSWDKVLLIKFKQLIIPLTSWSIFVLCKNICKVLLGIKSGPITIMWLFKEFILGFIYGPWFLWAIWWCSLIIIIVKNFFNDNKLIYTLISLLTFILPDALNFSAYKFMWPFFLLAYMFNSYDWKNKLKNVYLNKTFILSVTVLFIVLLLFYDYDKSIYISGYTILNKNAIIQMYNNIFRFTIGMAGSITMIYIIHALTKILPNKINRILTYIGKNTFGIYIISGYIFNDLIIITASLTGLNYFYLIFEILCVLCISIIINALLKKFKLTNRLFLGGR